MNLKNLTKSKTLEVLKPIIKNAKVLPQIRFLVSDYTNNKSNILNEITRTFEADLIIRSSSSSEDGSEESNAGEFTSILNVDVSSKKHIEDAIDKVILSYKDIDRKDEEVFVQPMLSNVSFSGVILTSDLDTLSPYYIINYDESGRTDLVTSGLSNKLKTRVVFKKHKGSIDKYLNKIIEAAKECENIFSNNFLDIEFAFSGEELFIFQVRELVEKNKDNLTHIDLSESLRKLHKKIEKLNAPHPNLLGSKTIFGVMPDWNPAEIIGIKPKRLALSLYKALITDETWAYQRDNYGYRNLRSHPLLVTFIGVPYIDVRVSFNSFIPKELKLSISSKLVNHYLSKLEKNKKYHDKVEFEIIYSCFYFGIEEKLLELKKYDFNDSEIGEIKESLITITNQIINNKKGLYKKDLEKVEILKIKYDEILESKISTIDKIYWLIKDARRYGTLPFAGVARAAFIAVQFLKSFVDVGIINENEYSRFLNSLNTVSKQLSKDLNSLSKKGFLKKYGHLRPGTYDIMSSRYDEAYDKYFKNKNNTEADQNENFSFDEKQKQKINTLISKSGLNIDAEGLIIFIREAIEGREYSKFIFTKSLSQVLIYVEEFGSLYGFSKEDLSYLNIETILNLYSTLDHRDMKDILGSDIKTNREFYDFTKSVKLPDIIDSPNDIYNYKVNENDANFVSMNRIESTVVEEKDISNQNLSGKIICIKSADPGYDFLFSKNIGGLITCFGGANSHMAIRCAELGIPAVIGCGELTFDKYRKSKILSIDAVNKNVKIIS